MSIVLKLTVSNPQRILRGQAFFWSTMRQLQAEGRPITINAIYMASNERHRTTISSYVRRLEELGFVERTGEVIATRSPKQAICYRIVRDQATAPAVTKEPEPRQGRAQQNMWNVMRRAKGGWTASELALDASTDDVQVPRNTALAYSVRLQDAGMLVVVDMGAPGRERRWRLKGSADTGPKPPKVLRSRLVYDQNRDIIVGPVVAEEERP